MNNSVNKWNANKKRKLGIQLYWMSKPSKKLGDNFGEQGGSEHRV